MNIYEEYVHLVRLALNGQKNDVIGLAKKRLKNLSKMNAESGDDLRNLIAQYNEHDVTRSFTENPLPIDIDSKLELLRRELCYFSEEPVWAPNIKEGLEYIVEERKREEELLAADLAPIRTMLFVGPPGVGKTYAAKWIASKLNKPLLTLDLAAVMSSFLGRTGNNVRAVLNYAQNTNAVLLLDEFDAIAKKRNDDTEIGELKRLVTVLLQTIDDWPVGHLLIAATNHPELLDPAVWRRFEKIIEFPLPAINEIDKMMSQQINPSTKQELLLIRSAAMMLGNHSFADIKRFIEEVKRESIIRRFGIEDILKRKISELKNAISRDEKINLGVYLVSEGYSQREVNELLGVSRDTLRKRIQK